MQGMSERQYAAHAEMSRGAIQKAKGAGRLVLFPDGSINPDASDALRVQATDPGKSRRAQPLPPPGASSSGVDAPDLVPEGNTFLKARTANEVLKAREREIRLRRLKGDLVEKDKVTALVFRLGRIFRDTLANRTVQDAPLLAARHGVAPETVLALLSDFVHGHLADLPDARIDP